MNERVCLGSQMGVSRALRHKRFQFRHPCDVLFRLELKTTEQIELLPINCSLGGIAGKFAGDFTKLEIESGDIIPSAKLVHGDQETALGRLVLRTITQADDDNSLLLGFSLVDSKVPIDGVLSKYLEIKNQNKDSAYDFELSPNKFSMANFMETNESNVDLFAKCKQFEIFVKGWKQSPKFLYSTIRTPSMGKRVELTRVRKGRRRDYLVMCSNDYLGLAARPEIIEASKRAMTKYGFGATGSPLSTGRSAEHEELCDFIAKVFHKEEVLLFNSGYAANIGSIQGITGPNDLVVADILSHASIQDGMRMAQATCRFFKHNNLDHLQKILASQRNDHAGTLLITEGVFSMDGDTPPLREIISLAKKQNCRVFLDEAHSFGVIGKDGLGLANTLHCIDDIDIIMGTFSKIAGGIGGFIACDRYVKEWLYIFARSQLFSVALPPSSAAAALAALKLFRDERELVSNLQKNIRHFVHGLIEMGCPLNPNHESAVVPVVVGDEQKLGVMNQILVEAGILVVPIVFPVVGRKSSRFRFTLMATHTISDLDFVLHVLESAMKVANFSFEELKGASSNPPGVAA